LKNLDMLTTMLSMISALLDNTNLFLEPYVRFFVSNLKKVFSFKPFYFST